MSEVWVVEYKEADKPGDSYMPENLFLFEGQAIAELKMQRKRIGASGCFRVRRYLPEQPKP